MLIPFVGRYVWQAAAAGVALLSAAGLVLALGQGMRHLIDHGFASGSQAQLNHTALAMFGVVAALAVATACRFSLVSWLGEQIGADIRRAAFNHVLSLSPAWSETARSGDVLSRLITDTTLLQALTASSLSQWLRSTVLLVGALAMLVATSPLLSLLVLAVIPVVVLPLIVFSRRERRLSRMTQERLADLAAMAEEAFGALRTVQAFNQEPQVRHAFSDAIQEVVSAGQARARSRAVVMLIVILLGFGAITLALWVGGHEVLAGRMSAGALSAFVFYSITVATAGAGLSELWGDLQRAAGAADRIADLLSEQPAIASPAQPLPLPVPARGALAFDQVTFFYPARPDRAALHDFTLHVRPGETVALVGPSGAGKTTVFQLLMRFYDPHAGTVSLDGVDLRQGDLAALRSLVSVVPQDPVVFGADVWTNIRFGRPDASDADVRAAAAAASCDFVAALPDGFDTFLGEKGVRLSGGQRQRLAIARAILRNSPILLLDEATSALDSENEHAVQEALRRLETGRTTVVIAHRLATVRRADRIVVMNGGRIEAIGSHQALVAEGGLYARLAALQFKD
ncbi:ABC transporter transmembrane domain-containing protein [Robbsia sp. Bb-Pol-6]|uniref:ABC transporter transmembrane domain-containing protein n=1 Tax=Robbsia betulipollinis TaxID=2981849 RepID=A0ABT3ZK12_9BURK|nr:ABC transporter transmembrane domain-containing protein [Robbsia betulipollinis]